MKDEMILKYLNWCRKRKFDFQETMAVFERLFGSEIRARAEKLWSVSQHSQEEFADGKLGRKFSKGPIVVTSRNTLFSILIAIGVAIVVILIIMLVVPVPYDAKSTTVEEWSYGEIPGVQVRILLKSNFLPIDPTNLNMRATFGGVLTGYDSYRAVRIVAHTGSLDRPYAYGEYVDGKLVDFAIY
jgi:hypothetical protein